MTLDLKIFSFLNSFAKRSSATDAVIVFFARYAPYLLVLAFAGFVASRPYPRQEALVAFAIPMLAAVIARFFVVPVIRVWYKRRRPFSAYPVRQLVQERQPSFPSGHATFFFALSAAVYSADTRWGSIFLIVSAAIAVSRVIAGVHYPSDIIAGALIGCAVAYGILMLPLAPLLLSLVH